MVPVFKQMLGIYIRDQRERLGLSKTELARTLGYSPQHLGRIEAGISAVTDERLPTVIATLDLDRNRLWKIFHYSLSWFLDDVYSPGRHHNVKRSRRSRRRACRK